MTVVGEGFHIFFHIRGLWLEQMQIDGCNRGIRGVEKYILPQSIGADLPENKIIA